MKIDAQGVRPQILEEASNWFIEFNDEAVDAAGCADFDAWLRRSPEHVSAFLQISVLWEEVGGIGKRSGVDIPKLVANAKAEHNVFFLGSSANLATGKNVESTVAQVESVTVTRGRPFRWLAAAASICLAIGLGSAAWRYSPGQIYVTETGEQRVVTLEDGSAVELNSRSRIMVRFTQAQRSVDLLEGQALFTVAKNSQRPFTVTTGETQVRAVGTQFDVYRKRAGTLVTVIEGHVAVAFARTKAGRGRPVSMEGTQLQPGERRAVGSGPVVLPGEVMVAAGEQLMITPTAMGAPRPANLTATTAWTDQQLVFESTTLREVVEELNRYNRQQLVIRDPELNDLHISGVFPATDAKLMLAFLRQRFGVSLKLSSEVIEISRGETPR